MLEYASSIWNPVAVGLIDKIEFVQRHFTKRIPCLANLTYEQLHIALNLDSLEKRRLVLDLILMYKIVLGQIDVKADDLFVFNCNATRGHDYKIVPQHSRVNARKRFFSNRVIDVWNALPSSIIKFDSLTIFKNSLSNCQLTLYTRY